MSFSIVTDSCANLPDAMLQQHGITTIPLSYFINGTEHFCTSVDTFGCKDYYDSIRAGMSVTTSQTNPQRYMECFRPILEQGSDVLFIGLSGGVSGSYASSEMAASQLRTQFPTRKIRTVDSLCASLGIGLMVLWAAGCRKKGLDLDQTADFLLEHRMRMYQVFTVNDLKHLHRSGRISGVAAMAGTVLNIKPLLLGNEEGKIINFAKVRGRKKVIEALAEKYNTLAMHPERQIVGITHTDCEEDAKYLAQLISAENPPKKILILPHEPFTGAHLGPDSLALYFAGDKDVRTKY